MQATQITIVTLTPAEANEILVAGMRSRGMIEQEAGDVNITYRIGTVGDSFNGGCEDPGYDAVTEIEARWIK